MSNEHAAAIFKLQADICKTLADPNRLMILHELRTGELSVGEIVKRLGLSQSNVSRHLALLRERAIVRTRRDGTTIYYSLANPKIGQACDLVRDMLEAQLGASRQLSKSLNLLAGGSYRITGSGRKK